MLLVEPESTPAGLVPWEPQSAEVANGELRLLVDQQRSLARQMTSTRESVAQVFTALEMMVSVLSEVMTRIKNHQPADHAALEPVLDNISSEVKSLRQFIESRPDPQPPNLRDLTVPLTAAFERLDRRTAEHIDKTVSDRMQGLYEALREDFDQQNQQRDRIMRREIDRLLFFALGIAGLLTGGGLWLLLKP
jgi:CRISPR/Cas system CSM-associated protein Csm2 small subunit